MPEVKFDLIEKDNVLIFRFSGEFTNNNVPVIFEEIQKLIKIKGHYNAIFNFEKIETINSRVAGGIASIFEILETFNGKLILTNLNDFVDDALDLMGMFLFLQKTNTEEEALKLIK